MTTFVGYDKNLRHEADRAPLALRKHFVAGFDYDQVGDDRRGQVQQHEAAIVTLLSRCAADCILIGKHLLEARELLGPRLFTVWCSASFRFGQATCSNYMSMARRFGEADPAAIARCDIGALAELSRERVPDSARREALQLAAEGQRISQSVAYAISERHAQDDADREPVSPRPPAKLRGAGAPTSADVAGDEAPQASAPLSVKQKRDLTNLKSVLRQMLRRHSSADRPAAARRAIEALREVLDEFQLDEHFSANVSPLLKAAARQVRAAGVAVL